MDEAKAVAVVGIACRFPGAETVNDFWRVLKYGENHVKEVPPDRWSTDAYYSEDRSAPGRTYAKHAGFIKDVESFDYQLFGINAMEAERMDPQHRQALEVSYMALEDAGFTVNDMSGTNTAVFMGVMNQDYNNLIHMDPEFADNYTATGTAPSILSNRLSYIYDVHGPSLTVDSACSSGMMAVHLGSQAILTGQSNMAICGGVNVILSPTMFVTLSKARMASGLGQCHTYSEKADGYARSEGCGVVILKDLEKAREDRDRIWGIISTVANSDGKATSPITSPSRDLQVELIESALSQTKLSPDQLQFVEMHGTGTPVGDPIETAAVAQAIALKRSKASGPCLVGSVKTNIGHTEAAAGIAGLIKVLLMMKHDTIVPSVIFGKLKGSLNIEANNIEVVQRLRGWPNIVQSVPNVFRACVNCFGFGGTNTHVVVQSCAQQTPALSLNADEAGSQVILFTGYSAESVLCSMRNLVQSDTSKESFRKISYTSCHARLLYPYRNAIVADSLSDLKERLEAALKAESFQLSRYNESLEVKVIFVFCGMGTHWKDMGRDLYAKEPVYKETIDKLRDLFLFHGHFDLTDALSGKLDMMNTSYSQPAVFACQAALFNLWKSKGILPDVVIGHSVGEVAAAYASGLLTLDLAAFIICQRGQAVSKAKQGRMLAVGQMLVEDVESLLASYEGKLEIAAINSPTSCTISGNEDDIDSIYSCLEEIRPKPFIRKLNVNTAFHSFHMEGVLNDLSERLQRRLSIRQTDDKALCQTFSTVTGKQTEKDDYVTSQYWLRNVRQTVRFKSALTSALNKKHNNVIIEVGPRPALKANIKEIGTGFTLEHLGSMGMNRDDLFNVSLAKSYELGIFKSVSNRQLISDQPRYGMIKTNVYKEPPKASSLRFNPTKNALSNQHPFVTFTVSSTATEMSLTVNTKATPFVYDHMFCNRLVVPGATYVEAGICCCLSSVNRKRDKPNEFMPLRGSVTFMNAKFIGRNTEKLEMSVYIKPIEDNHGKHLFSISSADSLHASGCIEISSEKRSFKTNDLMSLAVMHSRKLTASDVYTELEQHNFKYGESLQVITRASVGDNSCLIELTIPKDTVLNDTTIHPCVIDGILQSCILLPQQPKLTGNILPYQIRRFIIYHKVVNGEILFGYITSKRQSQSSIYVDALLLDSKGMILASFEDIKFGVLGQANNFVVSENMYMLKWREHASVEKPKRPSTKYVLICLEEDEVEFLGLEGTIEIVTIGQAQLDSILEDHTSYEKVVTPFLNEDVVWLYCLGLHFSLSNIGDLSGEEMQEKVLKSSFPFVQLVKFLYLRNFNTPVCLITRGVFSLINALECEKSKRFGALLGASILASARCINKEIPMFPLRCIDVCNPTKQDMKLFYGYIESESKKFEIAIKDGVIHYGSLCSTSNETHSSGKKRKCSLGQSSLSLANEEGKGLFLKRCSPPSSNGFTGILTLKTTQLGDTCLQPYYTCLSSKSGVLKAMDSIGTDIRGKQYMFCMEHEVKSRVAIDDQTVCTLDEFPSKVPCLSYWLIMWHVMRNLPIGQTFRLLTTDVSPFWEAVAHCLAPLMNIHLVSGTTPPSNGTLVICNHNVPTEFEDIPGSYMISTSLQHLHFSFQHHVTYTNQLLSSSELYEVISSFKCFLSETPRQFLIRSIRNFEAEIDNKYKRVGLYNLSEIIQRNPFTCHSNILINMELNSKPVDVYALGVNEVFLKDSAYVIVGGSKGLGFETAQHIAKLGVRYICIISRNGVDAQNAEILNEVQKECKCKIIDMKADVCDENSLRTLFDNLQRNDRLEIKGIFYGAALTSDAILPSMTKDKYRLALNPKVVGAWNIFRLVHELDLDIFIMQSSITSLYGNAGQVNYAAGNGFMDALACIRRIETGVGQSICWGALQLGILKENTTAKAKLQSFGLQTLSASEIMECLDHAIESNKSIVCYALFDWSAWYDWVSKAPLLLKEQYMELIQDKCHYLSPRDQSVLDTLSKQTHDAKAYVSNLVKTIVCFGSNDIERDVSLFQMGADSQDRQKIHAIMMDHIGFTDDDLKVNDIAEMTINDLVHRVEQLNRKDDLDVNTNSTKDVEDQHNLIDSRDNVFSETLPKLEEQANNVTFACDGVNDQSNSAQGNTIITERKADVRRASLDEITKDWVEVKSNIESKKDLTPQSSEDGDITLSFKNEAAFKGTTYINGVVQGAFSLVENLWQYI